MLKVRSRHLPNRLRKTTEVRGSIAAGLGPKFEYWTSRVRSDITLDTEYLRMYCQITEVPAVGEQLPAISGDSRLSASQ
jgi:hypothetical protein